MIEHVVTCNPMDPSRMARRAAAIRGAPASGRQRLPHGATQGDAGPPAAGRSVVDRQA